jgi:hypothetical protein
MSAAEMWRRAKTPVTLLILLGLLWWAGDWAIKAASSPVGHNNIPCVMTDVGGKLTPDKVLLRVFNTGDIAGAAKLSATQLRAYGFKVQKTGNATTPVQQTTVVGFAADDPEVKLVMGFLKNAVFKADGRLDHSVDVLIGKSKIEWTDAPATSIDVTGPVCLAADVLPSASVSTSASVSAPAK